MEYYGYEVIVMKINKLISLSDIAYISLKIGGILTYITALFINNKILDGFQKYTYGKTNIYVPILTTYQFSIIKTIPLFILTLIGLKKFILILKSIENKKTPFTEESVTIFKKFSKTILYYGVIEAIICICGDLVGLVPKEVFSFDVIILIFPLKYVLAALMMWGVAYIIHQGIGLQSENDMFV